MPEEKLEQATEQVEETKTYSQEEFEAALKSETDRRVTQALKKQAEKLQEAERLSKLDGDQREKEEVRLLKEKYEEGLRELALEQNKNAAAKILNDKGLDLGLVDLVLAEEAEEMNARIQLLDKAFKKSVKAEVEKRLASKSPVSTLDQNKTYSKSDFAKMTLQQLAELKKTQPELFEN